VFVFELRCTVRNHIVAVRWWNLHFREFENENERATEQEKCASQSEADGKLHRHEIFENAEVRNQSANVNT